MKINTGNITMGVPGTILIEEPILIREVILIKNVILMVAGIPVVFQILMREAILIGEGFLIQKGMSIEVDILTRENMMTEITLISHLTAMLRKETTPFVMKLRDIEAFLETDLVRVEFQQVTPSPKPLVNNPEPDPRHFSQNLLSNNNNPEPNPPNLDWPSYLPQCTVSLLQASMLTLLLLPQSPLPPVPNSILLLVPHQPLLLHHLHPLLPLTLAASHLSLSAGWVLETLEGG